MSDLPNSDTADAPQLAAANPAVDGLDGDAVVIAPVAPGIGPVATQTVTDGIVPDLTLLDLEVLLNLDPTDGSRSAGRSLQSDPLQPTSANGELPADLTSLDLAQLLGLDLAGDRLPTLYEVAGLPDESEPSAPAETFEGDQEESSLSEKAQAADQAEEGGAPDGANPAVGPLLDEAGKRAAGHDFDLTSSFDDDAGPDISDSSPPTGGSPENAGRSESSATGHNGQGSNASGSEHAQANNASSNGHGNGPGVNNGQGNGAAQNVTSNANAGVNSLNAGGGNVNGNAGGNSGSNAGGNGNGAKAANSIVLASISFPGGGDLPLPITPADTAPAGASRSGVQTSAAASAPANVPASVPPAHSASTFVSGSDAGDGPGNSSFGASNGNSNGHSSSHNNFPAVEIAFDAGVSSAPPETPEETPVISGGGVDTIFGTPGADNLQGTGQNDTINGLAGDDTIDGGGGDDLLIGGDGDDVLNGKGGDDTLQGGAGDDTLNGGGGSDLLDGGAGADNLFGGGGADVLVWDFADLVIDGGGNTDTLRVDGSDNVDLTNFAGTITGIDRIDLSSNSGDNTVTLDYADVLSMTDNADTLTIFGDSGDSVITDTGWTYVGLSDGFHTYSQGSGTLIVEIDVTVTLV